MKILISPLGLSSGVVTGAYYALRDRGWGDMNEIITISTSHPLIRLCEKVIQEELDRARQELGVTISYNQRLYVENTEIRNATDVYRFRRLIRDLLRANLDAGHEVYLSLTGGHKSMVAAAAMAAQTCKSTKIFYVYVDEEVEREGRISTLLNMPTDRRRFYLKPPPDKINLVEIPFLSVGEITGMDPAQLRERIFEFAVGAYLATKLDPPYTQVEYKFYPDYLKGEGLGEVDVLATRQVHGQPETLLCECKMSEQPVQTDWITRLARKREKVIAERSPAHPEQIKACIVTIAAKVEDADEAREHGIEVYQAHLSQNWQGRADWEVERLTPLVMIHGFN